MDLAHGCSRLLSLRVGVWVFQIARGCYVQIESGLTDPNRCGVPLKACGFAFRAAIGKDQIEQSAAGRW
jgi:hypothetical protein